MIALTVEFVVKPDHVDEFRARMDLQARDSITLEKGCRTFDVCYDPEDRTRIFLYETYDNEAALQVHKESDHLKSFFSDIKEWLVSKTFRPLERHDYA